MAFQITKIIDSHAGNLVVNVLHQSNRVTVTIRDREKDDLPVGKSFQAEISYDEILGWKVIEEFCDEKSGIWEEQDGIHLLGRIHNILDYGDGKTIIDVYVQNGPEFFTVSSDAIEDLAPDPSDGLEIVVKNLYIFPTS